MPLSPQMKKYGIPGIVVVLLIIGGIFALKGRGPSASEESSVFLQGEKHQRIGENAELRVHFPVPMKEESVTQHLTIDPPIMATPTWEDATTLSLDPAEPLSRSGTYTVSVAAEAERQDGAVLGKSITVEYFVAGPPVVRQVLPPVGRDDVRPDQPVTIIFDRPMVALTTLTERGMQVANWTVTISPNPGGSWRWLSTTTVEYHVEKGLAPSTAYTVTVPAGIATVNGEKTEQDFSWSFMTSKPRVMSSEPPDRFDTFDPKGDIVLHFNQDIDLASVREFVVLARAKEEGKILSREQIGALQESSVSTDVASIVPFTASYGKKEVEGESLTDRTAVVVNPSETLSWNTWHAVVVRPGIKSPGGSTGSDEPFALQLRTAGPMEVRSMRQEYGAIVIEFSNPYETASVKKAVTISPKPAGWDDLTIEENAWESTTLYLYPSLEPSTEYTVKVSTELKDTFGQRAPKEKTFTFKTEPLPPRVFIHSNGNFGVFERGKPPVYYLNAVNVSKVDVAFAKFSLSQFLADQRAGYSDWQHVPVLQGKDMYRTWTLTSDTKENEWKSTAFNLEEELGTSLPGGIYALTLSAPEYRDEYTKQPIVERNFFTLSNTALTLKFSGNHALVWAVDMQTGKGVGGMNLTFHNLSGKAIATGVTDAEGFYEADIDASAFAVDGNTWNPEIWVTATKGDEFAFVGSSFSNGMSPWEFGFSEEFQSEANATVLLSHIYTDRPLYRAGDEVHFKGILRTKDAQGMLQVPGNRIAEVRIDDAEGNTLLSKDFPISAMGSFNGTLPLDPKASLGSYSITVGLQGGGDNQEGITNYGSASFQVLAYRKPEFQVDVTFDQENYYDGDTAEATVQGTYYFGMSMAGASLTWYAMTTDYFFNNFTDGWYSFSLEDNWCWYDCAEESEIIASGEGQLDSQGKFSTDIPINLESEPLSQVLSFDANVTDDSNQVVNQRGSMIIHKADVYVGIRTEDYGVEPGTEAAIGLVTVKPDGTPAGGQRVDLTVFKRTWNTTRTKGVDGEYYYDNEPNDERQSTLSVTTGQDGKATAQVEIPSGGQFRILATVRDVAGREAKADTSVYAWSSTYVNWPHSNSNRMTVIADKPEYAVGDTAKLIVQSPYQGENVKALVTVEREGIIKRTVIPVTSSAQPIEVPITEDLIPNAYVSVVIVKPRIGETFNENGLDTGAPAFRIGYAKLKVETERKALTLSIEPNKRKYLPGETVEIALTAENYQGEPVQSELSLAVVDMSVLALAGYRVPDLIDVFYADRGLGIRTAMNLLYLLERFKPGSKGGGGGDLEDRARGTFKDTAYWNPTITTDAQGRAKVSFTLPDNLTTWKIIATAHTKESLVGAYATEIVETKNVIVRPVRPRFAVYGDRAELGAIVHNGTDERLTFAVNLTGKGFSGGGTPQNVTIEPDGQAKVLFPVSFAEAAKAEFVFTAESNGGRDEIHESIPLVPFGLAQSTATSGFTETSVTERVYVPVKEEIAGLEVAATLSPTLASYLPKGLEYLVQFPYGCAEQTVSSFLPNIAVSTLQGFDAFEIVSEEELNTKVTSGVERLLTFQRDDGGFGYWENSSESYPYLTAYVLHALHLAKSAGHTVDSDMITKARSYLESILRRHNLDRSLDLSERAYILFVMTETGSADVGLLNNLYSKRDSLSLFGEAYLAMSLEKVGDHRKAMAVLEDIIAAAKLSPRGTHFEEKDGWGYRSLMNTNTRTTAIALQALLRIDPGNVLIPNVTKGLLAERIGGHWDTTQSTVASIFALADYLKATGELSGNFTGTVSANGQEVMKAVFDASNILTTKSVDLDATKLSAGKMNDIAVAKDGAGRLYYDLQMNYFWKVSDVQPAEEGISITREITPLEGSPSTPTVGNTYKVKLTITVPEDRYFVAVESPHPAGFEGIDFALQTTDENLENEVNDRSPYDNWWWNSDWIFNHKEFRDDQVFLFADELPSGVYHYEYLVRATLPGRFQWRSARAYEMYFPEVFGNTESQVMEIRDKQ